MVIVNDAQIANDLLVKRSEVYADRPFLYFASHLVGWVEAVGLAGYTERFKAMRKTIVKGIGSSAVLNNVFTRVQEEEAIHFLLHLRQSPEKLFDHIRKEAGAVILKITYGYDVEPHGNDPLIDLAGKTMEELAGAGVPGRYLVDVMPFLDYLPSWLPGAGFKKVAERMRSRRTQTTEQPYQFVKQELRQQRNQASFLSQALESDPGNDDVQKWAASSLYLGGADTTVSSLMTFFLIMMLYPDVQRKAQEEIDTMLGTKIPLRPDCDKLPYITALVTELHRWQPVVPLAIPHAVSQDDLYNGYRIPKGALILPNTWFFTHDPAIYPEPMEFRPERFLGEFTQPDPRQWTFGYGRRVCPGRHVADNALLITVAQVLSVFNVSKPMEMGGVVEPDAKFEPGIVTHPKPYKVDIQLRSKEHAQLLEDAKRDWPWRKSHREKLLSVRW